MTEAPLLLVAELSVLALVMIRESDTLTGLDVTGVGGATDAVVAEDGVSCDTFRVNTPLRSVAEVPVVALAVVHTPC